jgi:hypothetical protein
MPYFANSVPPIGSPPGTMMGRASREESRGLQSGLRLTGTNYSRGSSHISDKSSKGRLYMKPNVIQPAAFKRNITNTHLPEVPEVRDHHARFPNAMGGASPSINPINATRSPYLDDTFARKSPIGPSNPLAYKAPGKLSGSTVAPSFVQKGGLRQPA